MDLMEYMAMELFKKYGLPVMKSVVIDMLDVERLYESGDLSGWDKRSSFDHIIGQDLRFPVVAKAQVQTGGRGKAGGIKAARDMKQLGEVSKDILGMNIKGHIVEKLLVAEKLEFKKEWYLSIMLDRQSKGPMAIFSTFGGMDIEEIAGTMPDKVLKVSIDPLVGINDYLPRYLLSRSCCGSEYFDQLFDILKKLYRIFTETDCTLVEINPLAVSNEDDLIAIDGKVTVDDSALYRQQDIAAFRDSLKEDELVLEARKFNFLYIPCDKDGNIAVMSNGSGMIMSAIDLISKEGMKVAAAFDLGGGATADRIKKAISIVLSNKDVKALIVNIFGGITRCDEVASGVKLAVEEMRIEKREEKLIIVSFEGTNKEKGIEILNTIQGKMIPVNDLRQGICELAARRLLL